jgi:carboxyl-terminal processing protease
LERNLYVQINENYPGFTAAIIVIVFTFTAGVMLGSYSSASDDANLAAIEDAWRIITEKYVEKDQIDKEALSQAAIQAMMEMIDDPYSSYLDPKAYQSSIEQLEGKFQGIGAEASIRDGQVVVVAPYAGSPAEKAGLEPGDIILAIDGQSTEGLNLMEVVLKVRGPKGTTVNLTVYRPSAGEELQFSIVRDDIYARSVEHEMISDYAYIYISQFAENTNQELGEVLEEIVNNGARGVILDLRYNPGGLADSVIDVASRFSSKGPYSPFVTVTVERKSTRPTVNRKLPTCRWWCWLTVTALLHLKFWPERCRIMIGQ